MIMHTRDPFMPKYTLCGIRATQDNSSGDYHKATCEKCKKIIKKRNANKR